VTLKSTNGVRGMNKMSNYIKQALTEGTGFDEIQSNCIQIYGNHPACSREKILENIKEAKKEMGKIFDLQPPAIFNRNTPAWYAGPVAAGHWPRLKDYLLNDKEWPEDTVNKIDEETTKIMALIERPGQISIETKGLVVGYVQSGKTANFTALIAKATDAGYRWVIVLSGITNSLRKQTQERLKKELVDLSPADWLTLTNLDQDFPKLKRAADSILTNQAQTVLAVVKKNASVLRRLNKWISQAHQLSLKKCPILVIDDECDQASINTKKGNERSSCFGPVFR